jgi:hypothetical protein
MVKKMLNENFLLNRCLTLALVAGISGGSFAQEASIAVKSVTLAGQEISAPVPAVWGDRSAMLDLALEAPLGSQLELAYDLSQVAGSLVAPVATRQPLGRVVDFRLATWRIIPVEIPFPKVDHPVKMLLGFSSSGFSIGRTFVMVFPREEPGQLAKRLASAGRQSGLRLGVFGESAVLRTFFKEEQIAFEELGSAFPSQFDPDILPIGEMQAEDLLEHALDNLDGSVLLFIRGSTELPGVIRTITPRRSLTKVTWPILDGLSGNPQSRQFFIDILLQALSPTVPEQP